MEWITDKEYGERMKFSPQKVRDMCNPDKDPHYCPVVMDSEDYLKVGKDFRILWNLSLNPDELRPRVRQRERNPMRRGNPNLRAKKKPLESIQGL